MLAKEFFRRALEREYLGHTIFNWNNTEKFVVHQITVEDGGVDPQWEISLRSKEFCEAQEERIAWIKQHGTYNLPPEMEARLQKSYAGNFYFTTADATMPEVTDTPELVGENPPDLDKCPQCDERAWDGYICHSCGAKNI